MAKNWSKYKVDKPIQYESYPLAPPEGELSDKARTLRMEMLAERPSATPKRAAWVVHGMGQQVPFATLEQLAGGLTMAAASWAAPKITVENPQFREVQVGKTVLQRAELTFAVEGKPKQQVDLYECYWAPKTEGAVKLADVIGFLWDGGSRGLINFFSGFQRALFGTMVPYKLSWRTPVYLLVTLATLGALMTINAIIVATGATLLGIGNIPDCSLVAPLTAVAGVVSAVAITFGVVLFLAETSKPGRGGGPWGRTIRNVTWLSVVSTVVTVVSGALLMALIFWGKCVPAWLTPGAARGLHIFVNSVVCLSLFLLLLSRVWRRRQVSRTENPESGWVAASLLYAGFAVHLGVLIGTVALAVLSLRGTIFSFSCVDALASWLWSGSSTLLTCTIGSKLGECVGSFLSRFFSASAWIWPFLFLISAVVRKLMVEYVGDVTAYVTSNKVDKFDDLRAKIKAIAKESLSAVYSAKSGGGKQFEYEKVGVVGHSLGSVIAYDTLNRLIADDKLSDNPAKVVGRTSVLLTFGSPLDKTAFFFSVMGRTTSHIREQLAAVVQPLIEDVDARNQIPWVNVFSRNDIIAGSLDFYDFPESAPPDVPHVNKVVNVKDEDAMVPLVAHVEYWSNMTVWKRLLEKVLDLP